MNPYTYMHSSPYMFTTCLPAAFFLLFLTQGLLRAPKDSISTEVCLVKLWRHECCRVFADKLTTLGDKAAFQNELDHQTAALGRVVLNALEVRLAFKKELMLAISATYFTLSRSQWSLA